jgi:hypothetical protein
MQKTDLRLFDEPGQPGELGRRLDHPAEEMGR